jgi:PadR family transcriptional regulator, regulatory protein PadR
MAQARLVVSLAEMIRSRVGRLLCLNACHRCGQPQSDLGKIRAMPDPVRVTGPLLDVLELFIRASEDDAELHGWAIMHAVKRSGPTIYGVLDRLEDMGWISGRWEGQNPEPGKPRRRLYQLTPTGIARARQVLRERRPQALFGQALRTPGHAVPGSPHTLRPDGAV